MLVGVETWVEVVLVRPLLWRATLNSSTLSSEPATAPANWRSVASIFPAVSSAGFISAFPYLRYGSYDFSRFIATLSRP